MSGRTSKVQTAMISVTALVLAACSTQVDPGTTTEPLPSATSGPAATESTGSPDTGSATGSSGGVTTSPLASTEGSTETGTETSADPAGTQDAPSDLPGFVAAAATAQQDPATDTQLIIDDVRLGLQDGYDRVVLDMSGTGQAGWIVKYVEAPGLDGSGDPVDLVGDFTLQISAQGMAYPEPGNTAYDPGFLMVDGGELQQVTQVLRAAPFEGQVQVFIGTQTQAPFRVFWLSEPERLVIDIQH
ncbi:MAG: AMIN domain-containing protein [Ornithinimicrobium sp.]|uniref:AMIN-like domain-containing (lipo)protein n=1 Tax=Ornithinimicrobium sp. TaxID=1977084 RepID=UPI0026DF54B7|nr:AMIN domain-containing protein [Ornithinimicrobium sp.]MDO5740825.1 AMIN domain-containing protein [Ornithinimicrobium sp.]